MQAYPGRHRLKIASTFLLGLILSAGHVTGPTYASGPAEQAGAKVRHMDVAEPASKADALSLLRTSIGKIEDGLARRDFPAIHAASYGVEAALTRIAKEPGYDGITVSVLPRCEIVHLASELEDGRTLQAAVPILIKAVQEQYLIQ